MHEKRSAPVIVVWLIAIFALVSLYLLSTGPAVLLRDKGIISQQTIVRVYTPVQWLYGVPFFAGAMESYLSFWSNGP
jgi:hypothetical protein